MLQNVKPDSQKGKKIINEDAWQPILDSLLINDDYWWCMITMLTESKPDQTECVSIFNEAAEDGERKAVYLLSYEKLINCVQIFSRTDPAKCPTIQGICHYANRLLQQESGSLPTSLIAKLIKYLIYRFKSEMIARVQREIELKQHFQNKIQLMQTATDVRESTSDKRYTQLRKRGEEWIDKIYIDDAPEEGPNLYIILTGFYDPNLPMILLDVGVPLTSILRIKWIAETLKFDDETKRGEDSKLRETSVQLDSSSISRDDLEKFWEKVETLLDDPERSRDFCKLMLSSICLPDVKVSDKRENLMKDIYDRVCYTIYDLYEIYRQHVKYLRSMKLLKVYEERPQKQDTSVYKRFMDNIPEELATAFVVLNTLLLQVENNLSISQNGEKNEIRDNSVSDPEISTLSTSKYNLLSNQIKSRRRSLFLDKNGIEMSTVSRSVTEKLLRLNLKYGIITVKEEVPQVNDIKLVVHNNLFHFKSDMKINFDVNTYYPQIAAIWEQNPFRKHVAQKYAFHIDQIVNKFERKIDCATVRHYLHLLAVRKIFQCQEQMVVGEKVRDIRFRSMYSLPSADRTMTLKLQNHSFDFGKDWTDYFECPILCALVDPREILQDEFIQETDPETDLFSEFDSVELLSPPIFQQALQSCFEEFSYFRMHYFEPTDTILLFFNHPAHCKMTEEVVSGNLPTAMCLREFCTDFINKFDTFGFEEKRKEMDLKVKERIKSEGEAEFTILKDANFILPMSLKAEVLKKASRLPLSEPKPKTNERKIVSEFSTKKEEKLSRKEETSKGKKEKSTKEKITKENLLDIPRDMSFLPKREKLVARCALEGEPFELIGYDLGDRRFEISSTKNTFCSIDGIIVNTDLEAWLNAKNLLKIGITISRCRLQLHSVIDDDYLYTMFPLHFTTPEGLIIAFTKKRFNNNATRVANETKWWDPCFNFCISWPSGLQIEPVAGDSRENPFYIQQKYISEGPKFASASKETHRKYLRNGTVLIFFEDGSVTVLKSDGTIIRCTEFEKLEKFEKASDNIDSKERETVSRPISTKGRKATDSKRLNRESFDEISFEQFVPTVETVTPENRGREPTNIKISRYSVLEPDGKRYEVSEGIVKEFNKLLVRTASSYEVGEWFTQRADGTDMLLKSNGDLIVSFPDGTHIKTGYIIEKEPLFCNWSKRESEDCLGENEYLNRSNLGDDSSQSEEHLGGSKILTSDSFVSVLLTSQIEHTNYSTVKYDQPSCSCTLSMPGNVNVLVSREGLLDITVVSKAKLFIRENDLTLYKESCSKSNPRTTVFYKLLFPTKENVDLCEESLLKITDTLGNIFKVKCDGTSSYESNKKLLYGSRTSDGGKSCLHEYSSRESEGERKVERQKEEMKSLARTVCGRGCRIFAMNRDLTAYEYLHRSERLLHEEKILAEKRSNIIFYEVADQTDLWYQLTFVPFDSLHEFQTRFQNVIESKHNQNLLRSTHSTTQDWLFPCGNNRSKKKKNTFDEPLNKIDEHLIPEVLNIRILRGIKADGTDPFVDTKRAIVHYCQKIIHKFNEYQTYVPVDIRSTAEREREENLRAIALGSKTTIEKDTYLKAYQLFKNCSKMGTKKLITSTLKHISKQTTFEIENYEWYRQCMREKFLLPYFENIAGACFLLVNECVERAMKFSKAKNGLPTSKSNILNRNSSEITI